MTGPGPLPWLSGGDDGEGAGSYETLQRGLWLLDSGNAAAAATVLERLVVDEPRSASVLEALARAQFTAGRPGAAARTFEALVEVQPDSDYARFGWGQSLRRIGRVKQAAEQLALAVALNPDRPEYATALARVRDLLDPTGEGVLPLPELDEGLHAVLLDRDADRPGSSASPPAGPSAGPGSDQHRDEEPPRA